ncbi:MAG TPA: RNA-binding protein, partial [Methylomirabilota bacterium]|nr:RNA-binding protein [Methylomirabilota bacterium]
MPVKLFVGGLSFSTTNESLHAAFARFGTVTSAIVMTDRATGRSRGFGFVEMGTDQEAERAISSLNGAQLDGRMIRVDKATPRGTAPARRPGGPGGGFAPRGPGGGGFAPRGPGTGGGFAPRGPGGGFAPRAPGPGGGF